MKIAYVYGVQHDFKHFFIFLLCYMACEILVPLPGMDSASPVLEAYLTPGPPGKFLQCDVLIHICIVKCLPQAN